jgi:4-nitrophenyl phosphatase
MDMVQSCAENEERKEMLRGYYLIQMDAIWRGGRPRPGAVEFLDALQAGGLRYLLFTEQSGKRRAVIAKMMNDAGFHGIHSSEIYTGAMAAADYIDWRYPNQKKAYFLGGAGVKEALRERSFEVNRYHPDWVFIGMNRSLSYEDYSEAFHQILYGARLVSVDSRRVQFADGEQIPGNGAVVKMLEYASETEAMEFGRGSETACRQAARALAVLPEQLSVVGNDFRRDLLPAISLGARTFYITEGRALDGSGITSDVHPDYIADDPSGLIR